MHLFGLGSLSVSLCFWAWYTFLGHFLTAWYQNLVVRLVIGSSLDDLDSIDYLYTVWANTSLVFIAWSWSKVHMQFSIWMCSWENVNFLCFIIPMLVLKNENSFLVSFSFQIFCIRLTQILQVYWNIFSLQKCISS
jgi:hypothetical protein